MKKRYLSIVIIISFFNALFAHTPFKIVGLVPARNEELLIGSCLKALSLFTDAIIFLDDASQDNTLSIVESLAKECNIERIHAKKIWYRDEPGDRNLMLKLGREVGGTHFIVIDADEMFTASLLHNNHLRNAISQLNPGDQMIFHWIRLWKDINHCRTDGLLKEFIFCDDGICSYESSFIHTPRVPANLIQGKLIHMKPYFKYGLLHFQAVNWDNMALRQAWYHCIMKIRRSELTDAQINRACLAQDHEESYKVIECPSIWFDGYPFFDASLYQLPDMWRRRQILEWFDQYGKPFFAGLNIWHIDYK